MGLVCVAAVSTAGIIALLNNVQAPAAIVPLFNLLPNHPDWLIKQLYYLDNLDNYPASGNCQNTFYNQYSYGEKHTVQLRNSHCYQGIFQRIHQQDYRFEITVPIILKGYIYQLVTLNPNIDLALQSLSNKENIAIRGQIYHAGNWLLVEHITHKTL
ncbi:hypothetical protein IQ247_27300 [Plectonema cf. radiosum LEGE 06105]|uniref:Uncharacterized protein n=1 Tax=Plectonema cf. radiosum LEGE 06105 TaxID=945769 RepID=A0A8J7FF48_9CYAN|nr:hypothetical protein [Plectonema radiosum]MBE9216324.1 hypothetical protein [Plectonema cf. radiosum LEGE 06105]